MKIIHFMPSILPNGIVTVVCRLGHNLFDSVEVQSLLCILKAFLANVRDITTTQCLIFHILYTDGGN